MRFALVQSIWLPNSGSAGESKGFSIYIETKEKDSRPRIPAPAVSFASEGILRG
jgi:hypothetical protein